MSPRDKLWAEFKGSAFPLVAEAIQQEVEAYKNSEDEIKRLKHAMVLGLSSFKSLIMPAW